MCAESPAALVGLLCTNPASATCIAVMPLKLTGATGAHVRPPTVAFACAFSASMNTKSSMFVVSVAAGIGSATSGRHVDCHSASLQSRAPMLLHTATACGYVMLVHGSVPWRD